MTVTKGRSTTYRKGTSSISASAIKNGQSVLVLGTTDGTTIAATQVIANNLVAGWTATSTQPGVASAIDPTELVREVQQVRKTADTVIE